jgi:hypothetical protein
MTIACDSGAQAVEPALSVEGVEAFAVAPSPTTKIRTTTTDHDPYAGWEARCEPDLALCQEDNDCKGVFHPSGKAMKCVKPHWSKQDKDGKWTKVCSPGWSNRKERQWRRDRLRQLVAYAYFDEAEVCFEDTELAEQPRSCQRESKRAEALTRFLWTVYARETTGRPWKRHRLNGDIAMAKSEWYLQQRRYGFAIAKDRRGQISSVFACRSLSKKKGEPHWFDACRKKDPSPHYADQERWAYGLGPYAMNAALFTASWDPLAPPEILCGEVEPSEVYLRTARRVWRKLRGGITCKGKPYRPTVTWEVLHRGVSGGQLCPAKKPSDRFRAAARRVGLDPDQVVTLEMLGEPIRKENQNEVAAGMVAILDGSLPKPGFGAPAFGQPE